MRILITGSFLQHNPETLTEGILTAELLGIDVTEIVTGCWVGADQLVKEYGKRHELKVSIVDLTKQVLPQGVDAIIILTCHGKKESIREVQWLSDAAEVAGLQVVVW
jgi:hypothetical protein